MSSPIHPLSLPPAAAAFDAIAERFDSRYGAWLSVAAQRRQVRAALADAFPAGAEVLEIGGGTGEDAAWLTRAGRTVLMTDVSPAMVRVAEEKLVPLGAPRPRVFPAEELEELSAERESLGLPPFDGAYSNFAALNCVTDLKPTARGLARLVRPGGRALLVLFGVCVPGEWIVQVLRGERRTAFRRLHRGEVAARLGQQEFTVRYHRGNALADAFTPWFRLVARRGIGVFVPPSASEPWMSQHPGLLRILELADHFASKPLARLGDHVLFEFVRTEKSAAAGAE